MMNCPVCERPTSRLWETLGAGDRNFTGVYACFMHGRFKASGFCDGKKRTATQWHPCCPKHGADRVIELEGENAWACRFCGRVITFDSHGNRHIVRFKSRALEEGTTKLCVASVAKDG